MKIHDRAWEGFKIVVLSDEPMSAMKIEQAIASAAPAMEVQLASFESYEEAYRFCKDQKDVGFFFLHEKCGDLPFVDVFRELSRHFDGHGVPAFATILHNGAGNSFNEKLVGKSPLLLDYVHVDELLDVKKTAPMIEKTWAQLEEAFEDEVFSKNLQASLNAAAVHIVGQESFEFANRLSNNLLSNANVTWLESNAVKWSMTLQVVSKNYGALLVPHQILKYFVELCEVNASIDSSTLETFLKGNGSICSKIATLTNYLENARANGSLESELERISAWGKPGAPMLVRHVVKNKSRILSFSQGVNVAGTGGRRHG